MLLLEPGDAPTDFDSMVVNSTAIRLTWDSPLLPYGIILSYTITYNTSDGDISLVQNSTDPRDIIVADLQEHTWYRFEIVASTRVGSGPSAYLTTRTDISGMSYKLYSKTSLSTTYLLQSLMPLLLILLSWLTVVHKQPYHGSHHLLNTKMDQFSTTPSSYTN